MKSIPKKYKGSKYRQELVTHTDVERNYDGTAALILYNNSTRLLNVPLKDHDYLTEGESEFFDEYIPYIDNQEVHTVDEIIIIAYEGNKFTY